MTIWMWRFLQKKTKAIIGISIFYAILITLCILLSLLKLSIFIFSNIIDPNFTAIYITSIYAIIILFVLMFYRFRYFIKIIMAFGILVSMYFLGILWLRDALFEQHSVKIEVSDNIDIVVLEASIRVVGEQYFYIVENGIFLKFLATAHSSKPEFRYGNYNIEYIDDDTFAIIYEYSNVQDIYLFFDVIDDKVYFSSKSYVPR